MQTQAGFTFPPSTQHVPLLVDWRRAVARWECPEATLWPQAAVDVGEVGERVHERLVDAFLLWGKAGTFWKEVKREVCKPPLGLWWNDVYLC